MERLTIDEAIEKYKDIVNTDANCPRHCMRPCDECVLECGQVAEWLEELKSYRLHIFSGEQTKAMLKEERNKAIDDFADYLRMSYDKGKRLSVAMCKNEVEKLKLKALYSRFIKSIDDCVKAFNEMEQLKERESE